MKQVFISYSRRDQVFARRLFDHLKVEQLDSWADREGIPYSSEWWAEICKGIEGAEIFVCILSPNYYASKICNDELSYARSLNKRIIPVVRQEWRDSQNEYLPQMKVALFGKDWLGLVQTNEQETSRLNFLFFRKKTGFDCQFDEVTKQVTNPECDSIESDADDFNITFQALLQTIQQDHAHVAQHTRLSTKAKKWETNPDSSLLLRGEELRKAENWLTYNAAKDPKPSDLHKANIQASLDEQTRAEQTEQDRQARELVLEKQAGQRLRYFIAALSLFLLIAAGLSWFAFDQSNQAQNQADIAQSERERAEIEAQNAVNQAATSQANVEEAWRVQSLFLADLSRQQLEQGRVQEAVVLAMESLEHRDVFVNPESRQAFFNAISYPAQEQLVLQHEGRVNGASWNGAETQLLTWARDRTAKVWDAESGELAFTLQHEGWVNGASWNGAETQILTWAEDGAVKVWDAESGELAFTLQHEDVVWGASWNGAETQILTWSSDETAKVWDAESGELAFTLQHEDNVNGASWKGDGNQLLTWSNDETAKVWDAESGELAFTLQHEGSVWGANWNEAETQLLTWSSDETAKVWDAESGELAFTLQHEGSVWGANWNEAETQLLTRSSDETAKVWDAESGELAFTLQHEDNVNGASWKGDGNQLLTWSSDGTAKVWDAESGELAFTLQHEGWVGGARWNGAETQLLTWSSDETAKVWDAESGELAFTLQLEGWVNGASWNGAETQLLTWAGDGTAKVWTVDLDQLLQAGEKQAAVRPLTNEQREQFFLPTTMP